MNNKAIKQALILASFVISLCAASVAVSGDHEVAEKAKMAHSKDHKGKGKKDKMYKTEPTKKELMSEMSFIAGKLLEMSGKDEVTYTHEAYSKPFLGVCPNYKPEGMELKCITPGHAAEAAGLKTGDVLVSVNGEALAREEKSDYMDMFKSMKPGKVLNFTVSRAGETLEVPVTVGKIEHPAYTITISKN